MAGVKGGYALARPPHRMAFLHVVEAVEGLAPVFKCTELRQRFILRTPSSRPFFAPCSIKTAMDDADEAVRATLRTQTIA